VLAYGGLPEHLDKDKFTEEVNRAQSVAFFTLVFMQWFNLLATRTRRRSLFAHNPFWGPNRNWWVIAGMACSAGLLFFFSYPPFFQTAFLTRGAPVEYIFLPFAFGAFILLVDEARKWAARTWPGGLVAKISW
jgi:sodium/potassium-transporting ATPase subunit alpha